MTERLTGVVVDTTCWTKGRRAPVTTLTQTRHQVLSDGRLYRIPDADPPIFPRVLLTRWWR